MSRIGFSLRTNTLFPDNPLPLFMVTRKQIQ